MLLRQCVVLFLLGLIVDLLQTIHIQACAEKKMCMSVSTIVAIYVTGFFGHKWFVEHERAWPRWWLTVAGALGAGLGTAVVIYLGE